MGLNKREGPEAKGAQREGRGLVGSLKGRRTSEKGPHEVCSARDPGPPALPLSRLPSWRLCHAALADPLASCLLGLATLPGPSPSRPQ